MWCTHEDKLEGDRAVVKWFDGDGEPVVAWSVTRASTRLKSSRKLTSGPGPFKHFPNEFQTLPFFKFKTEAFPYSKNIQTLHEAISQCDELLSPLDQLQIPTADHVINFGTD
jgi:hypothetical protein